VDTNTKSPSNSRKGLFIITGTITSLFAISAIGGALFPAKPIDSTSQNIAPVVAGVSTQSEDEKTIEVDQTTTPTQEIEQNPEQTQVPTDTPTSSPTAKPTVKATVVKTATPKPTQAKAAYTCNCSKTCEQITTCAEAQYQLNTCGCSKRDADKDGIACDGAPLKCQ
jgi:hypothetical protein